MVGSSLLGPEDRRWGGVFEGRGLRSSGPEDRRIPLIPPDLRTIFGAGRSKNTLPSSKNEAENRNTPPPSSLDPEDRRTHPFSSFDSEDRKTLPHLRASELRLGRRSPSAPWCPPFYARFCNFTGLALRRFGRQVNLIVYGVARHRTHGTGRRLVGSPRKGPSLQLFRASGKSVLHDSSEARTTEILM